MIEKKYIKAFVTVAACILFYFLIANFAAVRAFFAGTIGIFRPVLYGFVIAYLLWPIMKLWQKLIAHWSKKKKMSSRGIRVLSLILAYLVAVILIGLIILLVVPQTADSITTLIANFSTYSKDFTGWVNELAQNVQNYSDNDSFLSVQIGKVLEGGEEFVNKAVNGIISYFPTVLNFVTGFTTVVGYLLVGVILSVYMLYDKDMLIARIKKLVLAVFKREKADKTILFFREVNETVGDFIKGKILNSFIIGVLSYLVFLIFGIKFPALLAVIVGVTDIIPIFGPIIGAIPCGLILLIVAPRQVILFIIIVIVIQQLDGNILGPKILSKATGVSGFWVMVSLTIGGGLFGIMGMILAVPVFAVMYKLLTEFVNKRLVKIEMTTATDQYYSYPITPPHEEAVSVRKPWFKNGFFGKHKEKKNALPPEEPKDGADEKPEEKDADR